MLWPHFPGGASDEGRGASGEGPTMCNPFASQDPATYPAETRAIRLHGGNLQVDSQLGKWTRFTVNLPGPK